MASCVQLGGPAQVPGGVLLVPKVQAGGQVLSRLHPGSVPTAFIIVIIIE